LPEKATTYRIDTNNIFMLGSSAGAFIALHNAYWDTILLATTNFIYEQLPKPTAAFSYDSGCPVYFNNESDGLISSCWDFGDNSFSAEFQPSHTYVTSDTFLVSLSVINYLGIIDNQEQNIYFPKCEANAVSSSDFGKSFQIYPNPTKSYT
jgi:PKD repeat protein